MATLRHISNNVYGCESDIYISNINSSSSDWDFIGSVVLRITIEELDLNDWGLFQATGSLCEYEIFESGDSVMTERFSLSHDDDFGYDAGRIMARQMQSNDRFSDFDVEDLEDALRMWVIWDYN